MPLPRVAILLPTWNGEKYLHEQVDSLLAQDYPDFLIVSRDDGSRDSSPAIIADYAARFPQRFHIAPVAASPCSWSMPCSTSLLLVWAVPG